MHLHRGRFAFSSRLLDNYIMPAKLQSIERVMLRAALGMMVIGFAAIASMKLLGIDDSLVRNLRRDTHREIHIGDSVDKVDSFLRSRNLDPSRTDESGDIQIGEDHHLRVRHGLRLSGGQYGASIFQSGVYCDFVFDDNRLVYYLITPMPPMAP
jgi:hypothetical protein